MLQGVRIVDLTSVVFGPYCTQILADLGADVIKVEPPGGDPFRAAGKPAHTPGMGPCHMTLNRGKRSVALDLKTAADHTMMLALLRTADVFIHNVRAKGMDGLALDYASVRALKADIVYVHCTGFGAGGPYAGLQAYDDVIQAATGATSLASYVDGNPQPRYIPSTVADKVAGLNAVYATLAAIVHRLRTGQGQFVEVPMFECFTQFMLEEHLFGGTFVPPTGPIGYNRQVDPNRQPFPTRDGWISIVPYADEPWRRMFAVLGRPGALEELGLTSMVVRSRNVSQLYAAIAELTPARTTQEWLHLFAQAAIPAMAARDIADILSDPHLAETGFFRQREHPSEGSYIETAPPVRFAARPRVQTRPPPTIGQHTEELRAELGLPEVPR